MIDDASIRQLRGLNGVDGPPLQQGGFNGWALRFRRMSQPVRVFTFAEEHLELTRRLTEGPHANSFGLLGWHDPFRYYAPLPRSWLVGSLILISGLRTNSAAQIQSRSISTSNCRAPNSMAISTLGPTALSTPRSPANGPPVTCTASPICTAYYLPRGIHS